MDVKALVILGALALVLAGLMFLRRRASDPEDVYDGEDDEDENWDDDDDDDDYYPPEAIPWGLSQPTTRFKVGQWYLWEQIEDLLWSYGYGLDAVNEKRNRNYIEIYRDGLSAVFNGGMGEYDKDANQLYFCTAFDPEADTSRVDRWRRQPTTRERRSAVYLD